MIRVFTPIGLLLTFLGFSFACAQETSPSNWPTPIEFIWGFHDSFIVAHENQFSIVKATRKSQKDAEFKVNRINDVQRVAVALNGRTFVTQETEPNICISEFFQDLEKKTVGHIDREKKQRYGLISNESGTIVWLVFEGRAVAFDVARGLPIVDFHSDTLNLESCVFCATKKDLIVARIDHDLSKTGPGIIRWNGRVLRSTEAALTPLFSVDGMLFLCMVVGPSGELIICAREDLHAPTSGLVRCLEAGTYQMKWETTSEYPLSACVCRDLLLLTSGGKTICAYDVRDGTLLSRVKVGASDWGLVACTNDATSMVTTSIDGTQVSDLLDVSTFIKEKK